LALRLEHAHGKPCSPLVANQVIEGWFDQLGPCFRHEHSDDVICRLRGIAADLAFDGIPPTNNYDGAGEQHLIAETQLVTKPGRQRIAAYSSNARKRPVISKDVFYGEEETYAAAEVAWGQELPGPRNYRVNATTFALPRAVFRRWCGVARTRSKSQLVRGYS
jgi:hypothetical protein